MAAATPAAAAQITAVTSVNVVKPVALAKLQDMDFGTLTFAGFTGSRTITLSRLGAITCATDIVCSGATTQARFNAHRHQQADRPADLQRRHPVERHRLDPVHRQRPGLVTLTNSGAPGTDFDIGGALTISPALVGGVYSGTMTVTADYQ